jgi:hypothetical protein
MLCIVYYNKYIMQLKQFVTFYNVHIIYIYLIYALKMMCKILSKLDMESN